MLGVIIMTMDKFQKTDKEIKNQIINWFLKYHGNPIDSFNGQEEFTLFDKISANTQKVINALALNNELPVLVLKKDNEIIVVCTTRRFVYFENNATQELKYSDFEYHTGYKSINVPGHTGSYIGVKTDGYISEFGLRKNEGYIVYWKIPTGHSGFAFWNVTKKFSILGRKYIIRDTE
jgi:hypothetical protein